MQRLITAAVLIPLLWVMIKLAPTWVFLCVALVVISAACVECYRMFELGGAKPFTLLGLIAGGLLIWSFLDRPPIIEPALPLVGLTIGATVLAMWRRPTPQLMLTAVMQTLFPVLFVGLALGYVIRLREVPGDTGSDLLLLLFVCVISSDTAAYYVGRRFGRHKLAPALSPKKTWEGAIGGVTASAAAAIVACVWFYQALPPVHAPVLGVLLGGAGVLGDLAESLIKRACGVKDSSGLLPGHGGLLDRTDSLLFAAPALYYYHVVFLQVTT